MVKCPRGTAEQVNANLEYLKSLHFRNFPSSNIETDGAPLEQDKATFESPEETEVSSLNELDIIRSDKRSPPTTEDEITFLFVNHFLDILLKCWNGTPCLRPKLVESTVLSNAATIEESVPTSEDLDDCSSSSSSSPTYAASADYLIKFYKEMSQKISKDLKSNSTKTETRIPDKCKEICISGDGLEFLPAKADDDEKVSESTHSWKYVTPDENVYMSFQNGAWYRGRVSRRLMDGDGTFFWEDGTSFQGEFIGGAATGYGRLEFPNQDVYEGFLYKGFRHGEGLQIMNESPVMYSGEWWLGKKNGEGVILYENPARVLNFYKGSWVDGNREGFGYRQYPSGSKYIGYWKNGKRDGTGIMFWCNNDIYRGEWKNGVMDGYGEYVWNGFINKTFSYPRINAYRGFWKNGKRNGIGLLELANGAFIETEWVDNEKNGPGAAICPNGTVVADGEKLFKNDKPALKNENEEDLLGLFFRNQGIQPSRKKTPKKKFPEESQLIAFMSSMEKAKAISIPIHTPIHTLDLTYHVKKLEEQINEFFMRQTQQILIFGTKNIPDLEGINEIKPPISQDINQSTDIYAAEEKLLRHSISVNLIRLMNCYDKWATIACSEKPPFQCTLLRIFFWDLLIQARVPRRNLSLVDIDNLFKDEIFMTDLPHDPFERIQQWQFIHFLIAISWNLYGRYVFFESALVPTNVHDFLGAYQNQSEKAVLATAFNYFLKNHIFDVDENYSGQSFLKEKDLVPLEAMYMAYKNIGEPHSAKQFLSSVFNKRKFDQTLIKQNYFEKLPNHKLTGENAFTFINEISYLPTEEYFNYPEISTLMRETEELLNKSELSCFASLKPKEVVTCLVKTCSNIKSENLIVDMEYQLTFLEFYKAVITCAQMCLKKTALKEVQTQILKDYKQELEEYEKALKEYEKQRESTSQAKKAVKKTRK